MAADLAPLMLLILLFVASGAITAAHLSRRQLERSDLRRLVGRLGHTGAAVSRWGDGHRVRAAARDVAFRREVLTSGQMRAGIVDVWRLRVAGDEDAPAFFLQGRPALTGDAPIADLERRPLEQLQLVTVEPGREPSGKGLGALRAFLNEHPVRELSLGSDGVLEVVVERRAGTSWELEALLRATEELSERLGESGPGGAASGRSVAAGSRTGEPVAVPGDLSAGALRPR